MDQPYEKEPFPREAMLKVLETLQSVSDKKLLGYVTVAVADDASAGFAGFMDDTAMTAQQIFDLLHAALDHERLQFNPEEYQGEATVTMRKLALDLRNGPSEQHTEIASVFLAIAADIIEHMGKLAGRCDCGAFEEKGEVEGYVIPAGLRYHATGGLVDEDEDES